MNSGSQPQGKTKPSNQNQAVRSGRPVQNITISQSKNQYQEKYIPIENIQEKKRMIAMIGNPQYIELSYIIGMYGNLHNSNYITREMDELYEIHEIQYMLKIQQDIIEIFGPPRFELREDHLLFMKQLSHYWKSIIKYELCFVLIFAILYGSQSQMLQLMTYLQTQANSSRFQTILLLIQEQGHDQFYNFIDNLNKQFHLIKMKAKVLNKKLYDSNNYEEDNSSQNNYSIEEENISENIEKEDEEEIKLMNE